MHGVVKEVLTDRLKIAEDVHSGKGEGNGGGR